MEQQSDRLKKIRSVCRKAAQFEHEFEQAFDISLNESVLLCSLLNTSKLCSGEIAQILELSNSNTSKLLKSVEERGFIERIMGESDKRQMYFTLTSDGERKIKTLDCSKLALPEELSNMVE